MNSLYLANALLFACVVMLLIIAKHRQQYITELQDKLDAYIVEHTAPATLTQKHLDNIQNQAPETCGLDFIPDDKGAEFHRMVRDKVKAQIKDRIINGMPNPDDPYDSLAATHGVLPPDPDDPYQPPPSPMKYDRTLDELNASYDRRVQRTEDPEPPLQAYPINFSGGKIWESDGMGGRSHWQSDPGEKNSTAAPCESLPPNPHAETAQISDAYWKRLTEPNTDPELKPSHLFCPPGNNA